MTAPTLYDAWMIRTSFCGRSYQGFRWRRKNAWTEAPDWNPEPVCGGGLHGQGECRSLGLSGYGYAQAGSRLDFCEIDATAGVVVVDSNKLKCRRARVVATDDEALRLLVLHRPDFPGSLNLSDCTGLTELPDGLSVGGYPYLSDYTGLTSLPDGLNVGRYLYSWSCIELKNIPKELKAKVIW